MGKGNGEGEQERGERGWREEGRRGQAAGVREGVQGQLECGKPAWGGCSGREMDVKGAPPCTPLAPLPGQAPRGCPSSTAPQA